MAIRTTRHRIFDTPVAPFVLTCGLNGTVSAHWDDAPGLDESRHDPDLLPELSGRLARYFSGEAVEFDDVATPRGTAFRHRCWVHCRAVPRGRTLTYGELAGLAGADRGAQAAGQAMRCNPLPVIVPCHRIIAAGGRLLGYNGSTDPLSPELGIKRWLLNLERSTPR